MADRWRHRLSPKGRGKGIEKMVAQKNRCIIAAASPELDTGLIRSVINEDDFIICADGGLDKVVSAGIKPDLVVGDFDSLAHHELLNKFKTVSLQTEKDDTDTMHCAAEAVKLGFKSIVLLGAVGGRLDHTLANLSVLLYLRKNGAEGVIIDRYNEIRLLKQGNNRFFGVMGKTISVMPYGCFQAVLSYTGMHYPMQKQTVALDYPYTISNIAEEDNIEIVLHSGTALVIIVIDEN